MNQSSDQSSFIVYRVDPARIFQDSRHPACYEREGEPIVTGQPIQIVLPFFFTSISIFFLLRIRIILRLRSVANIHRFHTHRSRLVPGQEKWQ